LVNTDKDKYSRYKHLAYYSNFVSTNIEEQMKRTNRGKTKRRDKSIKANRNDWTKKTGKWEKV